MFWMPDQVRHDEFGLFTISSILGFIVDMAPTAITIKFFSLSAVKAAI